MCDVQVTTWDAFMAALTNKHMVLAPWADEVAVSGLKKGGAQIEEDVT